MQSQDILTYGISITTLEEVFLRVGHGDDEQSKEEQLKIRQSLKED